MWICSQSMLTFPILISASWRRKLIKGGCKFSLKLQNGLSFQLEIYNSSLEKLLNNKSKCFQGRNFFCSSSNTKDSDKNDEHEAKWVSFYSPCLAIELFPLIALYIFFIL
jgi:hypothetical protein